MSKPTHNNTHGFTNLRPLPTYESWDLQSEPGGLVPCPGSTATPVACLKCRMRVAQIFVQTRAPFAASHPAHSRRRAHTTPDKYSNFEVAFQETMLANFTSCSARQRSHVETTFLIIDLSGLSMWHCGKATLSFLSAMSKTAADHYPETMGRTYVRDRPTNLFTINWAR